MNYNSVFEDMEIIWVPTSKTVTHSKNILPLGRIGKDIVKFGS